MTFSAEGHCFGDRSTAMIIAGHAPRPSWYNARTTQTSRILVLDANSLVDMISKPGFELFAKYIRRFGVWASFKQRFAEALRSGEIKRIAERWHRGDEEATAPAGETAEDRLAARLEALIDRKLDAAPETAEDRLVSRLEAAIDRKLDRKLEALAAAARGQTADAAVAVRPPTPPASPSEADDAGDGPG